MEGFLLYMKLTFEFAPFDLGALNFIYRASIHSIHVLS
jgi:hypothetical protein